MQRVGPDPVAAEWHPHVGPRRVRHMVEMDAARMAEAEPHRRISAVLGWKDAWCRHTMCCAYSGAPRARAFQTDRVAGTGFKADADGTTSFST